MSQYADEQSAMVHIDFASGAVGNLWLSYEIPRPGYPASVFRSRIVGDTGILDVDGFGALRLGRGDEWSTLYEQEPIDAIGRMFEWPRLEAFVLLVQDFVSARGGWPSPARAGLRRAWPPWRWSKRAIAQVSVARSSIPSWPDPRRARCRRLCRSDPYFDSTGRPRLLRSQAEEWQAIAPRPEQRAGYLLS